MLLFVGSNFKKNIDKNLLSLKILKHMSVKATMNVSSEDTVIVGWRQNKIIDFQSFKIMQIHSENIHKRLLKFL